jgi:energy-coupling factor transporter ATP-binding protein EcfA2
MLRSISLLDYQSHRNTVLPLGPFTVIVGSSSSGKSAIVRALQLVSQNARGTSYVRQGAKSTRVSLELAGAEDTVDASTVVTVERGKSVSAYTLSLPGARTEPVLFTKCAAGVPDAVAEALGLGDPRLWVAGQFDRPFLLSETGAEVARVLGTLTNVTMIYSAVREAVRKASEARKLHTLRSGELESVRAQFGVFTSLPVRLAAADRAEQGMARAEELLARRDRIASRVRDLTDASERQRVASVSVRPVPDIARMTLFAQASTQLGARIAELREAERRSVVPETVDLPNTSTLDELLNRRSRLAAGLKDLSQVIATAERLRSAAEAAQLVADQSRARFAEALQSAGSCPLCGASSAHAQIEQVV